MSRVYSVCVWSIVDKGFDMPLHPHIITKNSNPTTGNTSSGFDTVPPLLGGTDKDRRWDRNRIKRSVCLKFTFFYTTSKFCFTGNKCFPMRNPLSRGSRPFYPVHIHPPPALIFERESKIKNKQRSCLGVGGWQIVSVMVVRRSVQEASWALTFWPGNMNLFIDRMFSICLVLNGWHLSVAL